MDASAAKLIGAGIASLPLLGAGIGLGLIFGNFLAGAFRNPSAAAANRTTMFIAFALTEATGLFGLVVSLLILFVF